MTRRSLITFALLLATLLGLDAMSGFAQSTPTNHATASSTNLRITYSEPRGGFGPERYRLRCDPASGSLPNPRAACTAIANEPELVLAGPGVDHSCPAGVSSLAVRGDYLGQHVEVDFSPCTSRPGNLLESWLSLLPAALQHQESVRLDRGFGLFSLGERRSAVTGLLLRPQERFPSLSVYRPELVEGATRGSSSTFFGVGYNHAGRLVSLLSNWGRLEIKGFPTSLATPTDETALIRRLTGWVHVRCGGVSGLMDRPLSDHVAKTVVWMMGEQATVNISDGGVAICSAAIRSLIHQPVRSPTGGPAFYASTRDTKASGAQRHRPLCRQSADPGAPPGEPFVKHSRTTELVSGLFLGGGPLRLSKRCRHGVPSPGTITVTSVTTGKVVASEEVKSGQLARIPLVAGTYTITGTFADAFSNNEPIQAQPRTVTIVAKTTVRQDVSASIK